MGDFRQGGRGGFGGGRGGFGGGSRGGRPSFGGDRGGFRGGDRGPVTMTKVICDECKKPCEVPFRPTAGKPVYCTACFGGKREGGNDRGGDRFPRKSFGGGDYKTPPRTDFGNDINKVSGAEIKKLLESMNSKMDNLVKILGGNTTNKPVVSPAPEKAKEVVKVAPVEKTVLAPKVKKAVKKASKK